MSEEIARQKLKECADAFDKARLQILIIGGSTDKGRLVAGMTGSVNELSTLAAHASDSEDVVKRIILMATSKLLAKDMVDLFSKDIEELEADTDKKLKPRFN